MIDINECIELIKEKHSGQKRKQGTPYYLHPVAVCKILAEKELPVEYQITGLLHDLIEDTDTTYEEIMAITNSEITEAVRLLSKKKGYVMKDYIEGIKQNKIAHMVKLADRYHNLSETVLASTEFQKKYIKETKEWYVELAKGTIFENDINDVLIKVEEKYNEAIENERE